MSFHVPEQARDTTHPQLGSDSHYGNNGMFLVGSPEPGWRLALICSDGTDGVVEAHGWEHVSVHAYEPRQMRQRTPTWKEMSFVKDLCWDGEDVVMQLHPRRSQYVNNHPHVLHLWRSRDVAIPEPPAVLVGVLA